MRNKLGLFILVLSLLVFNTASWSAEQSLPPNWPWRGIDTHSCCGGIGTEDIALLAELNVNAVMLNLKVRFQAKNEKISPELSWAKNLAWADSMLDACKKHGITANIRLNEIPIDPADNLTERSVGFWNSPEKYNQAVKLAGQLAEHFKARGNELGAYTILSEPTVTDGKKQSRPAVWPKLQQEIIAEIRKHDETRYIVVAPGPGGMPVNYSTFTPFTDKRIIYGAHMYAPHAYTHQGVHGRPTGAEYPGMVGLKKLDKEFLASSLRALKNFQQQHNALVLIGEFSAVTGAVGAELYLSDVIALFDSYGWGWTYFSYKENPLWDPSNDKNIRKKSPDHPLTSLTTPRWEILKSAFNLNKKNKGTDKLTERLP